MKHDPFSEFLATEAGDVGPISPAVQIRIFLRRSRRIDRPFEEAWEFAWDNVRWPHDTAQRLEWKATLETPEAREAWRLAYHNEPCAPRQLAVARLAAVA